MKTTLSVKFANGLHSFLDKDGPVTDGGEGTITLRVVPSKYPAQGKLPSRITTPRFAGTKENKKAQAFLRPMIDKRVRISIALKNLEKNPSVTNYTTVRSQISGWSGQVVSALRRMDRKQSGLMEDAREDMVSARDKFKQADATIRTGNYDSAVSLLREVLDVWDEIFGRVQRTAFAAFR